MTNLAHTLADTLPVETSGTPHEVLLVDDDLLVLQELRDVVQDAGMVVYVANDPREAVERVIARPAIDTIMTDLTMPVLNGLELIRKIRERCGPERRFRFIILTGNATVAASVEALHLGVSHFLTKPCNPDEMIHALESAFASLDRERADETAKRAIIDEQRQRNDKVRALIGMHQRAVDREHGAREKILAMLTDEIRGPLSTIVMLAEGMEAASASGGPDYARLIGDKGKEVLQKFDLLGSLAADPGNGQASTGNVDLRELVRESVGDYRSRLPGGAVRMIGSEPDRPLMVRARRPVLRQTLALLFSFLTDHLEATDRVWLSITPVKQTYQLAIMVARTDKATFEIASMPAPDGPESVYRVLPAEQIEVASARILMRLYGGDVTYNENAQVGRLLTVTIPRQPGLGQI